MAEVKQEKKWYVVHVYSGSEKRVKESIEEQSNSKNMVGKKLQGGSTAKQNIVNIFQTISDPIREQYIHKRVVFGLGDFQQKIDKHRR